MSPRRSRVEGVAVATAATTATAASPSASPRLQPEIENLARITKANVADRLIEAMAAAIIATALSESAGVVAVRQSRFGGEASYEATAAEQHSAAEDHK
eukprot:1080750-Pleurochrysis_carterae.AAC.1